MRDQAGSDSRSNPAEHEGGENLQGTMMQYGLTLTPFLERAGKFFPGLKSSPACQTTPFAALPTPTCTAGPALWRQVCSMLDSDRVTVSQP